MTATTTPTDTMMVEVDRIFDATVERLWQLFTDPDEIAVWGCGDWYQHVDIDVDLRVGGVLHHRVTSKDDGSSWTFHGVYHAVDDGTRLEYSFDWKTDWRDPHSPSMVTLEFSTTDDGRAALHLEHSGLAADGTATAEAHWNSFLDTMARLA